MLILYNIMKFINMQMSYTKQNVLTLLISIVLSICIISVTYCKVPSFKNSVKHFPSETVTTKGNDRFRAKYISASNVPLYFNLADVCDEKRESLFEKYQTFSCSFWLETSFKMRVEDLYSSHQLTIDKGICDLLLFTWERLAWLEFLFHFEWAPSEDELEVLLCTVRFWSVI